MGFHPQNQPRVRNHHLPSYCGCQLNRKKSRKFPPPSRFTSASLAMWLLLEFPPCNHLAKLRFLRHPYQQKHQLGSVGIYEYAMNIFSSEGAVGIAQQTLRPRESRVHTTRKFVNVEND